MRHLAQIHHKYFIRNRLTQCDGQVVSRLLELLAADNALTGYNLRIGVGHFDTNRTLSRNGSDDTDAERRKAEGNIIFQTAYLRNADALLGSDFIQRHRRTYRRLNGTDFYTETTQSIDNLILVRVLLYHVNGRTIVIVMLHQVYCGVMIVFQIQTGIVRLLLRSHILLLFSLLNLECRLLLYRLFPKRGYRLRCRSLKSHGNVLIRRLGRLYLSITSTQVKGDFIQRFVLFFLCGNLLLLFKNLFRLRSFRCRSSSLFLCTPRGLELFRRFTLHAFRLLLTLQEAETEQSAQPDDSPCTQIDEEADGSYQQ